MAIPKAIKILLGCNEQQTAFEWIALQLSSRLETTSSTTSDNAESRVLPSRHTKGLLRPIFVILRFWRTLQNHWHSRFPGWRSGLAGFTILATMLLIINTSTLIWAAVNLVDRDATIAVGHCDKIQKLSVYSYFVINILSTGLLAGSNYCMQCLSSPTREEVDTAHAQFSYLNIGVISWRNLISCRKRRIFTMATLMLSSLTLHLVYNASIYFTDAMHMHDIALVTSGFFENGRWTQHGIIPNTDGQIYESRLRRLQDLASNGQIWDQTQWSNLTVFECKEYSSRLSDRGSVLLVTDHQHVNASEETTVLDFTVQEPTNYQYLNRYISDHGPILYCLSLIVPSSCRLQIRVGLLIVVVVINTAKVICFLVTFREQNGTPLITVGDAIASFLKFPCTKSLGLCLKSEKEVVGLLNESENWEHNTIRKLPVQFRPKNLRYHDASSFYPWAAYISFCMIVIVVSISLYRDIMIKYAENNIATNFRALWNYGFGRSRDESSTYVTTPWCTLTLGMNGHDVECVSLDMEIFNVLVASLPQLVVSMVYIGVNHQLTVMIQLRDWTSLASRRQPLRVSEPEEGSSQVATYWLSLPYRFSIPLLASSVMLSWLVSQALFPYRASWFDDYSEEVKRGPSLTSNTSAWGISFSAMACICAIGLGTLVFIFPLAVSLRQCAPGLPAGPTNSFVIAAACHPPPNDRHAARGLVKWGVVASNHDAADGRLVQHCTITSRKVEEPIKGCWYS
ncbi:hypothetical protein IQ07DRAFT_633570 [Pyrenochaeta sp. DS3sAY3a]|nr:hypothetical protein IQ07DRAFT_633570 [Pyrenochaeta sp. DS3sAY3a]